MTEGQRIHSQSLEDYKNQELVQEFQTQKKVPVIEIFGPTIQGEGPMIGSKTMFVRFGGCDYRCQKCDSLHAVLPQAVKANARRMTQEEIFLELQPIMQKTGTRWVTLSGGNPAMWDLTELVSRIHADGGFCAVETQGTLCPQWLTHAALVVVSPKTPGMGEKFEEEKFINFVRAVAPKTLTALKMVVFSQQDIELAFHAGALALAEGAIPSGMRFLSLGNPYPPVLDANFKTIDPPELQGTNLRDELMESYRIACEDLLADPRMADWKFLPQLHVLIWSNEAEH
jgi:7-carboxy-7-deazaguanine synthase